MTIRDYALGDIVETTDYGRMSYISGLVQRSGHYTIQVHYSRGLPTETKQQIETDLSDAGCTFDRWDDIRCILDVIDWDTAEKAFWILSASQERSKLFFETCWDAPEYGVPFQTGRLKL